MSSGLNWLYRIRNVDPEGPPISYSVGLSWSSGDQKSNPPEFEFGLIYGLDSIRSAYASLSGLGGGRSLWLSRQFDGTQTVSERAAKLLLLKYKVSTGREKVGYGLKETVGSWKTSVSFGYGQQIVGYFGVRDEDLFIDVWPQLAIAMNDWPLEKWGHSPKKIEPRVENWKTTERITGETEKKLLDLLTRWARWKPENKREDWAEALKDLREVRA